MHRLLHSLSAIFVLTTAQAQAPFCAGEIFGTMPSILSYSSDLVSYQGSVYAIHAATPLALSKYYPLTGTVSALAPPPFFLAETSLAGHEDKLYVFGGWTGSSPSNQAHVYDIVSNSWQTLPNMPVSITQTSAVAVGDEVYITGGTLGVTIQYFIRYNVPSNSYSTLASPASYANSRLITHNSTVYCFGGHRYNGTNMETSDLFNMYDATSNTWQSLGNMPFARTKLGAADWGDYLYIFGGHTCSGGAFANYTPEDDYFAYDFVTAQWTVSPNVTPVSGAQACLAIGDTIYTTSGFNYYCSNISGDGPCLSATPVSYSGLDASYTTLDAPVTLVGSPTSGVFIGLGMSGSTFDPAAAGEGTHGISYTYLDSNNCVNTYSLCTSVTFGMGLEDPARTMSGVRVFPNPNHGQFTVAMELLGLVSLQVFDARGRQVHNEVFQANGSKTQRTLDLSGLANGGYTVQVRNAGAMVAQQVIIE